MDTDYNQFWEKFNQMDKSHKSYKSGKETYEMLSTLIMVKVDMDATLAMSKFPNWFCEHSKKYIDRLLLKYPEVWKHFESEEYRLSLKDKNLRRKVLYKILNSI